MISQGGIKNGIDLLSQALDQLPSARPGLTTLFGMGKGAPRRHRHHKTKEKARATKDKVRGTHSRLNKVTIVKKHSRKGRTEKY